MHNFPKQYNKIESNKNKNSDFKAHPIFSLAEEYNWTINIAMLFRIFLLDAMHSFYFKTQLSHIDFLIKSQEKIIKNKSELKKILTNLWIKAKVNIWDKKNLAFSFYVQDFFAEIYNKWVISEENSLVYWSNKKQWPVDIDSIIYKSKKKKRYTLKYFVSAKNHVLDTFTEQPETIFGDVAIAVHPQHKRAKQLKWQEAIIPITNVKIPIIIDERADFTRYWGVYRVTPGHDEIGFEIAKDHNLPTDVYAIDQNWVFTDNAWLFSKKSVKDFFPNIVQNLSDIWNLIATEEVEVKDAFEKESKEKLSLRKWKGLFCKISEESISDLFEQEKISDLEINQENFNESYRLASFHDESGIPVPIRQKENELFLLNSDWLYQELNKNWENKLFAVAMFLLQLISIWSISNPFSVEQLIDIIFEYGKGNIQEFAEEIIKKYPKTKPDFDELLKFIEKIIENKDPDKLISEILGLLEKAFFIKEDNDKNFLFDFEKIDSNLKWIKKYSQDISENLVNTAIILKKSDKIEQKELGVFCDKNCLIESCVKWDFLLEKLLNKKLINKFERIPKIKGSQRSKDQIIDQKLIRQYHPDCIRISLLSLADGQNELSDSIFEKWDKNIANFWNACRYIYHNNNQTNQNIEDMQKTISENIEELSPMDLWMVFKSNKLIEESERIQSPKQIGEFINNLFDFVAKDLSSKYIEINKAEKTNNTDLILYYTSIVCIVLLQHYAPIISEELQIIFAVPMNSLENLTPISGIQKNYSISLLMDIIERFSLSKIQLCLKKHDSVNIFIRSNPDFLSFIQENELLLNKALNAKEIKYLMHHEEVPTGYQKEDIIDIVIWIKASEKKEVSGLILMEKQLKEKEEHLQYLRNLVQQMSISAADPSSIQTKRDEISTLKSEIEELSFEISKCKIK